MEEKLRVVRLMYEALNAHDLDRQAEFCVESVVHSGPDLPEPLKGREALRAYNESWLEAFPDFHLRGVRTFGEGEWFCCELEVTGTNTGPLRGPSGEPVPPTNKSMRATGVDLLKVEGSEITEIRSYYDRLGILAQLGLGPK